MIQLSACTRQNKTKQDEIVDILRSFGTGSGRLAQMNASGKTVNDRRRRREGRSRHSCRPRKRHGLSVDLVQYLHECMPTATHMLRPPSYQCSPCLALAPFQQEAAGHHSAAAVFAFTGRPALAPYLEKSFSQHDDAGYTSPSISVISHSVCCITRAAMPLMVAGAGPRMPRNALQAIAQSSKGPHLHQQTEFKNAHTASLAPLCIAFPYSK